MSDKPSPTAMGLMITAVGITVFLGAVIAADMLRKVRGL